MGHIQKIHLQNFRSFMDAECRLSPLTLVVGRNNCGKSNFLRAFQEFASYCVDPQKSQITSHAHYQSPRGTKPPSITISEQDRGKFVVPAIQKRTNTPSLASVPEIFSFDPEQIGGIEPPEVSTDVVPQVHSNGKGVTAVLRMLVQGSSALRKKFELIEHQWQQCVPEIVSLHLPPTGPSRLMVEQKNIPGSQPISDLSDGARLILAILTLVHQATPPPLILLEDLDHRIHPRLFEPIIKFLRDLTRTGAARQIIATTHNPYLVDEFIDEPEAVVVVEKHGGCSILANLDDRLSALLQRPEGLGEPLGQALFTGLADAPAPRKI
jgi:predicted ATPase